VPPAARRAVLALTALLALLAIAAAPAGAAPWGAPEEVSIPGGSASWSKVGIDAAGNATVVWTRSDGLHLLVQAAERPVGGSWGTPVDLSAPVGNAENVTLAVDPAGDVVVAWKQRLAGSEAIEAEYKPAGGSWGAPEAVEFGAAVVETPAVAIDAAGDAVLIWRQGVGGNHVTLATAKPASGSWQAPVAISSSALNAEAPDVGMSASGTAAAVWQSSSGATSVVESNVLPLGGSWTGEEAISLPATVTEPPHIVADPATGAFTAIWSRSGTGLVAEVASRPAGGGWQAPEQISTPALEAHAPVVAVDSAGDAVAAWYRFDGSVGSVEGAVLAAGGAWAAPVRISPVGAEAEAPQVAMSPAGAAQAVWSGWNESTHNYQLRTTSLRPNDTWQVSKLLSLEVEEAYGPHVALDHSGHSVVVWNGEVPLGAEIKSAFREITTPLLITKAGSGSGTVTSLPAGIDCGATCTVAFQEESTVTLTPEAAAGSSFAGWSGACSGTGACTVTIGEAQSSVGAEFVSAAPAGGGGAGEPGAGGIPVPGTGDSGTTTTATAATVPLPQAPPLKIIPACTSRRVEAIHWRVRKGIRLRSVAVRLDGVLYRSLPGGARSTMISLLGRPLGAVAVRIEGLGVHGRRYAAQRSYHPCASNRSHHTLGNNALKR
ncbi:MAG TPA: hypothetical protein VN817_03990, partial [Solirubrobacteraceae bacterium]|nr:hypothetical protein [Solirubrobacteraceae bacterium]